MTYDPEIHHRRSMRWYGYDYSRYGAYFVTVCAFRQECLFGKVVEGQALLNDSGRLIEGAWADLPRRFSGVVLDAFVVMPSHVHGIIRIEAQQGAASSVPTIGIGDDRARGVASGAPTLGRIVGVFKSMSARAVNGGLSRSQQPVWQRGYYDRVVRDESELDKIRQYITTNPLRWGSDNENPAALI